MRGFMADGFGRAVVLNLERGEKLLESIKDQLSNRGIKNAVILSAIGSLQKAVFHRVTNMDDVPVDEFVTLEKPMELASLQGVVVDGEPHFHMVISDLENTYTGHLEEGTTVLYLVEITLAEITDINVLRKKEKHGIMKLSTKV